MDQTRAEEIVQSLTPADIMQAYSGKPGCACGCNGKYYCRPGSVDAVTKSNGYAPDGESVSDRQVTRILRLVQAGALSQDFVPDLNVRHEGGWNVADDLQYVTVEVSPTRVYTVYLMPEARRARGVTEGFDLSVEVRNLDRLRGLVEAKQTLIVGGVYKLLDGEKYVAYARVLGHDSVSVFFQPDGRSAKNNPLTFGQFFLSIEKRGWKVKKVRELDL